MTTLIEELTALLNRHSRENRSNTPDFMLAEFMLKSLELWEVMVHRRDHWLDHDPAAEGD